MRKKNATGQVSLVRSSANSWPPLLPLTGQWLFQVVAMIQVTFKMSPNESPISV